MASKKIAGAAEAAPASAPAAAAAGPDPSTFPHAMWPRYAAPGSAFASDPLRGPSIHLTADEQGLVALASPEQVQFADELHLPAWGSPAAASAAAGQAAAPAEAEAESETPAEGEEA